MKHLGILRLVNRLTAVFYLGAFMLGSLILTIVAVNGIGTEPMFDLAVVSGFAAFFGLLGAGMFLLFWTLAERIGQGRWRWVQTAVGILAVADPPVGALYGLYALWVAWFNRPTALVFEHAAARLNS